MHVKYGPDVFTMGGKYQTVILLGPETLVLPLKKKEIFAKVGPICQK